MIPSTIRKTNRDRGCSLSRNFNHDLRSERHKKYTTIADCSRNILSTYALTAPWNRLQLLATRNHSVRTPFTTFVVNVCQRPCQQTSETWGVRRSWESFGPFTASSVT